MPAPLQGEHTRDVMKEFFGLDDEALADLEARGVILLNGPARAPLTILALLTAILTKRMTPLSALIAFPVAAALIGGFGVKTAGFMLQGIQGVAGVAGMFIFAILYFGIMTDAGMLDPIIDGILRAVGSNPARIVMGTSLLALLVHLDGSGAVTFLVTVPVMLPLYGRLGMDKRVLACAASMAAGVNFLPWTGPMIRRVGVAAYPGGGHF